MKTVKTEVVADVAMKLGICRKKYYFLNIFFISERT